MTSFRPASIDADIMSHVRKHAANLDGDNPLRYLPEHQRTSLHTWLAQHIQTERQNWKQRLDSSMKEIEKLRKTSLGQAGALQRIGECATKVLSQAGVDAPKKAEPEPQVEENVRKLADVCAYLVDDQSRCYSMLMVNTPAGAAHQSESRTLSEILSEKLLEYQRMAEHVEEERQQQTTAFPKPDVDGEPEAGRAYRKRKSPSRPATPAQAEPVSPLEKESSGTSDSSLPAARRHELGKERSTLVKNTIFTFDKMSLRMLVDGSNADGPMQKARRFHELEQRIEGLQDKMHALEAELERKGREIVKYKSNIRMLKRMYHYDTSAPSPNNRKSRRDKCVAEINGLAVRYSNPLPHLNSRKSEDNSSDSVTMMSTDETPPAAAAAFGMAKTSVSRCLRCQRLYRLQDNHKRACHYHPKAKKKFEKYTATGRLVNVMFMWECCKRDGDQDGCCTDQHI